MADDTGVGATQTDGLPGLPEHLTALAPGIGLLQTVFDRMPAMIGYWDRDLRNRLANAAYLEWFGRDPDEVRGMHIRDLLGPELFAKNLPFMEAALRGEPQTFDRTLVDTAGATRHTQASYIPDIVDGEAQGFFVLVTEITDRVEVERKTADAAERYRAVIRSLPRGFALLFDTDLRFTVADGEALSHFGYRREELEGRTVSEALPAPLVAEVMPRYLRALAGEATTWERTIDRRVYSLTTGPVRGERDDIVGGIVVCTDVTEERRGAAIAQALSALSAVVADGGSLTDVARHVAQALRDIFGLDNVGLMRVRDGRWARALASSPPVQDFDPELDRELDLTGAGMALADAVRTGRPALHHYTPACKGAGERLYAAGLRVGAASPILLRGEVWGALSLTSRDPDAIDAALMDRLDSVSELVGLAIANAEAWEALRREATTDPVTGLANHRTFQERLAERLAATGRDGRGCGLVLLDLDHFKRVNDAFGHPAGDGVLKEVGRRLESVVRGHELAARIGGEEFALVLETEDEEAVIAAAERARRVIGDTPFADVGRVTASAGAVMVSGATAVSPDGLIEAADRALYAAKRAGRDQVVGVGGRRVRGGMRAGA